MFYKNLWDITIQTGNKLIPVQEIPLHSSPNTHTHTNATEKSGSEIMEILK